MAEQKLEATSETIVIVKMSGDYAGRVYRSIQRVLPAIDKLDPAARTQLVNTGTVDDLLAMATVLRESLEY
jgi:hypothetical protein